MLLGHFEPVVVLGLGTLRPNVLRDHLVGYVPARTYEVSATPKVPAPERRPQLPVVHEKSVRGLTLDGLHHPARSYMRRHAQQQMPMIGPDMARQDFDVVTPTNLADQVPHLLGNLAPQDRLALLGGENEMVVQLIDGMGGATVGTYAHHRTASLLKASPQGEGFLPPRMRQ